MTARQEMARLSARLGLLDEQQDWGIVNGDAGRLDEFVRIYASETLTSVESAAMAELVLSSANERLLCDPDTDLTVVERLLPRIAAHAGWEYDYWRGLSGDGFPLGAWLRAR